MSASTDTKFRSIAHISGSKKGLEVFIPSEAKENDRTVATGFPTQIGYTIPVNNRKQIRYTAIKVVIHHMCLQASCSQSNFNWVMLLEKYEELECAISVSRFVKSSNPQ